MLSTTSCMRGRKMYPVTVRSFQPLCCKMPEETSPHVLNALDCQQIMLLGTKCQIRSLFEKMAEARGQNMGEQLGVHTVD